jgi:hypothetical protein
LQLAARLRTGCGLSRNRSARVRPEVALEQPIKADALFFRKQLIVEARLAVFASLEIEFFQLLFRQPALMCD